MKNNTTQLELLKESVSRFKSGSLEEALEIASRHLTPYMETMVSPLTFLAESNIEIKNAAEPVHQLIKMISIFNEGDVNFIHSLAEEAKYFKEDRLLSDDETTDLV